MATSIVGIMMSECFFPRCKCLAVNRQAAGKLAKMTADQSRLAISLNNQSHCENWLDNFLAALSLGLQAPALFEVAHENLYHFF